MALKGREWDQGQAGEWFVREWLKRAGFYVIPASAIENGGAPVLEGLHSRKVLPDLMAAVRGTSRWVEVKTKAAATLHRASRRWEHGCELSNWLDYLACEAQTGVPGWLAIVEQESGLLLLATLAELERVRRNYYGANMPGGRAMAFFPRDAFRWHIGQDDLLARLPPALPPKAARTLTQGPAPLQSRLSDLLSGFES